MIFKVFVNMSTMIIERYFYIYLFDVISIYFYSIHLHFYLPFRFNTCSAIDYHCKKYTQQTEIKSSMRQFAFRVNALRKGKNSYLSSRVNNRVDRTLQTSFRQPAYEKENCDFKPILLRLKIDRVSYFLPVVEGVNKFILINI